MHLIAAFPKVRLYLSGHLWYNTDRANYLISGRYQMSQTISGTQQLTHRPDILEGTVRELRELLQVNRVLLVELCYC